MLVDPWAAWANSVAAWCLVAFAGGALSSRTREAVLAGTAVELVGSYYLAQVVQGLPVVPVTVAEWSLAGVVMVAVGVALTALLGRSWWQRDVVLSALALVVPLGWLGTVSVNAVFAAW